jgi:hypothetical protein
MILQNSGIKFEIYGLLKVKCKIIKNVTHYLLGYIHLLVKLLNYLLGVIRAAVWAHPCLFICRNFAMGLEVLFLQPIIT